MATVPLTEVWLHDASDHSSYLRLYTAERVYEEAGAGEVRSYGSVRRIIVTDEEQQTLPLAFPLVTTVELAQLRTWKTQELMYRDPQGEVLGGAYFTLSVTAHKDRSGFQVAVTFVESSFSVEV